MLPLLSSNLTFRIVTSCSSRLLSTTPRVCAVRLSYVKHEPVVKSEAPIADHPVFILHGLFGNKQNWQAIAKALKDKLGQTIITVDARNHGESKQDSEHSYEAMSEDMEGLMETLNIPKAIVIGHSMGGKTAMCLALRSPSQVDSLIVVDSAPSESPGKSGFRKYISAMKSVKLDTGESLPQLRGRVMKEFEAVMPELMVRQFILTNLVQRDGRIEWRVNLDAIGNHMEDIMHFPVFHNFYGGPTLFISGEKSGYITEEEEPEIKRLFPKATIEVVPDAGHWVHSEKPSEVIQLMVEFLKNKEDH